VVQKPRITGYRIQSHASLKQEMMAVARGQQPAPKDAAASSFNSIDAPMCLLTPANQALLAMIRDSKPRSSANGKRRLP
jgi:predicted transcriptional regulator